MLPHHTSATNQLVMYATLGDYVDGAADTALLATSPSPQIGIGLRFKSVVSTCTVVELNMVQKTQLDCLGTSVGPGSRVHKIPFEIRAENKVSSRA